MNDIISISKKAQQSLVEIPTYEVSNGLAFIANTLKEQKQEFALLITEECKKPLKYALGEVDRAIHTFLTASEECKRSHGETITLDITPKGIGKQGIVKRFPLGVVLGITPFNFPLNTVAHKIAPAIASRNSIIIKPSPKTPKCAHALKEIFDKSGLPKDALIIQEWDNEETLKAVQHDNINFISFTGSDKVGWYLKSQAGKSKIALELGGNAAAIITKSANINKAIERCLMGGFAYSGQVCIHTQRIFVHEDHFKTFKDKFIKQTKALNYGDPTSLDTDLFDMISNESAERVKSWIDEATQDEAELLTGGKLTDTFLEPTILTNTKQEMKVNTEEVFGPVVVLESYTDYETVIHQVNDSPFGLQTGVFTDSNMQIQYAFDNLHVGGVIINDVPTFRMDHMPYGGEKNSGFGREGIKYAMEEMTFPKLLVL